MNAQLETAVQTMPVFIWFIFLFIVFSGGFMLMIYNNLNKIIDEIDIKHAEVKKEKNKLNMKVAKFRKEVRDFHLNKKRR